MSPHPAWLQALEKQPKAKAIGGAIGASFVVTGFIISILYASGQKVHTMTPEWKAANKEYMKFQKMNPISGISKGL